MNTREKSTAQVLVQEREFEADFDLGAGENLAGPLCEVVPFCLCHVVFFVLRIRSREPTIDFRFAFYLPL